MRDCCVDGPDDGDCQRGGDRGTAEEPDKPEDNGNRKENEAGSRHPQVPDDGVHQDGCSLEGGLELDFLAAHAVDSSPEGFDVRPPQDCVGCVGEPQGLKVAHAPNVVQDAVCGEVVDGHSQGHPPGHYDGEDAEPDGNARDEDEEGRADGVDNVGPNAGAVHDAHGPGEPLLEEGAVVPVEHDLEVTLRDPKCTLKP